MPLGLELNRKPFDLGVLLQAMAPAEESAEDFAEREPELAVDAAIGRCRRGAASGTPLPGAPNHSFSR